MLRFAALRLTAVALAAALGLFAFQLRLRMERERLNPARYEAGDELPLGHIVEVVGEPRLDLAVQFTFQGTRQTLLLPMPGRRPSEVLTVVVLDPTAQPSQAGTAIRGLVSAPVRGMRATDWKAVGPPGGWKELVRFKSIRLLDTTRLPDSSAAAAALAAVASAMVLFLLVPLIFMFVWGLPRQRGEWSPDVPTGLPRHLLMALTYGYVGLAAASFMGRLVPAQRTVGFCWTGFLAIALLALPNFWSFVAASPGGLLVQSGLTSRVRRIPWAELVWTRRLVRPPRWLAGLPDGKWIGATGARFAQAADLRRARAGVPSVRQRLDRGERIEFGSIAIAPQRIWVLGEEVPAASLSGLWQTDRDLLLDIAGEAYPRTVGLATVTDLPLFSEIAAERLAVRISTVPGPLVDWSALVGLAGIALLAAEVGVRLTRARNRGWIGSS